MDVPATINRVTALTAVVGAGAALIEALVIKFVGKRAYDWRAVLCTAVLFYGFLLSRLVPLAIGLPGAVWLYEHRIFDGESFGVWSYVLLFLGLEFLYYWWHRVGHRVRWFWVTHGVHHTSNELNIFTSFRLGWMSRAMSTYVIFAPLLVLGFRPQLVLPAFALLVIYQTWIHADWIPKLGFLEGILNTPSAHRVHHAGNLEYVDANYGAVVMLFDRLFGTYRVERADVPVRYGLVEPLRSYNPFKIAFFDLIGMLKDLRTARSVREVFGYLFGPPGWRPDGTGTTTEELRKRAAGQDYEPLRAQTT